MKTKNQVRALVRKYPFILAWGEYMFYSFEHTLEQMELAEKDNAPMTAIFKDNTLPKKWRTIYEIDGTGAKKFIAVFIREQFGWEVDFTPPN